MRRESAREVVRAPQQVQVDGMYGLLRFAEVRRRLDERRKSALVVGVLNAVLPIRG